MRAIVVTGPGGPEKLDERGVPDPVVGIGEVLITVAAAGVNRADVGQRQGSYPPPPGAPSWPGLEVSGTIAALGEGVDGWAVGDRVCALLAGGGYAELAIAKATHLLPVPDSVDLVDAAALPEVVATVWNNVFQLGRLERAQTLLVHGGSSGIGTMAIQLATAFGAIVAVTAGSPAKLDACRALGAEILIDYRREDFVDALLTATAGRGADVILDAIGGSYLERNVRALARGGRLMIIGNQSGKPGQLEIGSLMGRWASVQATMLRARPDQEKDEIIRSVRESVWPLVDTGVIRPIVDSKFPLADASHAHRRMESSEHIGKILLTV